MVSAKAFGFLVAIYQNHLNISAESLMTHFGVGRRSALSGLKELREAGFIVTKKQRINNRVMTISLVTELGERALYGVVTSHFVESHNVTSVNRTEQIKQNKTYSTVISRENTLTESRDYKIYEVEVSEMSGWGGIFESSENDYEADQKEKVLARKKHRSEKPKEKWTVPDVCFEFSSRIQDYFHIAPWNVVQSRFSGAMASARKQHGTNGAVEVLAMDLFFKQAEIEKYNDAEAIWKMFIHRFPSLIAQAKITQYDSEADEVAQKAREQARRRLRGENV